jgi:putative RNA 2'-phosphotransferase
MEVIGEQNSVALDYKRLSQTIARALRHAPEAYGLQLDDDGWTPVEALLAALRRRREWQQLSEHDLAVMMERSSKQRYEMRDGRIRAYYGHSTPDKIHKQSVEPPPILYHGTAPDSVELIRAEGLRAMNRQYVHLSTEQQTAQQVGSRKAGQPVLLKIRALEAYQAGVNFYHGNEDTWLADVVPPEYIDLPAD